MVVLEVCESSIYSSYVRFGPKADIAYLFDHLIGNGDHPRRHIDAKRSRRLQVDNELKLGRLQHRQVAGLGTLKDAAGINTDLTKPVGEIAPVAHQPAGYH